MNHNVPPSERRLCYLVFCSVYRGGYGFERIDYQDYLWPIVLAAVGAAVSFIVTVF